MTDKRYLYPIRHSHSTLNYKKKGQLVQLVRESDLFFRVKRQIKPVLTNVVAEHVKSRMGNAKQGNDESVVHNKLKMLSAMLWFFTDFIHESLSYLQNYPDS